MTILSLSLYFATLNKSIFCSPSQKINAIIPEHPKRPTLSYSRLNSSSLPHDKGNWYGTPGVVSPKSYSAYGTNCALCM